MLLNGVVSFEWGRVGSDHTVHWPMKDVLDLSWAARQSYLARWNQVANSLVRTVAVPLTGWLAFLTERLR